MASTDINLAERSGNLVESHKGYDPRILFFYFAIAALLVTLVCGLAYQQLIKAGKHSEDERQQNQRRVIIPGPRGNIYDRDGRLLVGNRPVFSVVLYVDELRVELRREQIRIRNNYRALDDKNVPSRRDIEQIARVAVAQRYLDQVNAILHPPRPKAEQNEEDNSWVTQVDPNRIKRHFNESLLLPYTLIDELSPEDYAKLLENLPVNSPLQVYAASRRFYPYKALAGHMIGYVRPADPDRSKAGDSVEDDSSADDAGEDRLHTFTMPGTVGKDGIEKQFDSVLQGKPGGSVFRVDPSGFRINPALEEKKPIQGKNLTTSIDVDLQQVAEDAIGDQIGAAVALDPRTGEVLVLASKPDFGDLNAFSPRTTKDVVDKINGADGWGGWNNLATTGLFQPGSTFKTVVTVAGLRSGRLDPTDTSVDCEGVMYLGRTPKKCDNGLAHHGRLDLPHAIAESCDIYYYQHGIDIGVDTIAAEARRFHLDRPTGIELPGEQKHMIIPDPAWKKKRHPDEGPWSQGDTANMAIGQGFVTVTPMEMACLAASLARGETYTQPTLLHDPARPTQHTEPIGITPRQRAMLVDGMVGCTTYGTASDLTTAEMYRIPGVKVAGKTGTAQHDVYENNVYKGRINFAWFICFAPAENPEIAMAVVIKGETLGENFAGGSNAAPIAAVVMKKYFEKKAHPGQQGPTLGPVLKTGVAAVP